MKFCPHCGVELPEGANNCPSCGASLVMPAPKVDIHEHTADYDEKDIHENKLYALLCYLFGLLGVVIAGICVKDSKYTKFHMKNSIKFSLVTGAVTICTALLAWTFIVPIAAGIFEVILFVVKIICIVNVCKNKVVDPSIISAIKFLD